MPPRGAIGPMLWASAHSTLPDGTLAAAEACGSLATTLGPEPIDLAIFFLSRPHVAAASGIAEALKHRLAPRCLIGASGHAVISSSRELESGPALVVLAARLPGVELHPFVMLNQAWKQAFEDPLEFARCAPGASGAEMVVMMGDPFTLEMERCLAAFQRHAPKVRVVGGLASAGVRPGSNALILNDWVATEGGVAVALKGKLRVDAIVSQGCRPVGPPLRVTRAEGNVVVELDGQPALERAEQVLQTLAERERGSLRNGLYVGRPMRAEASGRGDYLIRNLLGADRDRGIIAVGDRLEREERIRLHVRDAETAREDLEMLLSPQAFDTRAQASLLFACTSRGRGLYGEPDRDITMLEEALGGSVPAAGMFCAGEVGPVGGRNFLHGHAASIAIVRPAALM
jgi:small ligand-binding sensory domain FIST